MYAVWCLEEPFHREFESTGRRYGYDLLLGLLCGSRGRFSMSQQNGIGPNSTGSSPLPPAVASGVQPAHSSAEEQGLVELRQWFAANRFPALVLECLIASDIGVQDVLDLGCLGDEELQRAGMSPIQLKRFAVLQHQMNGAHHNPPTISKLAQNLDDIRRGFASGKITSSEASYMAKGVTGDLARLTGTDPVGLFETFAATCKVVPQVVSFIPAGPLNVKVSCPGESDRFIQTDSSGKIDVTDFPSQCSLQAMTQTRPPIAVGIPLPLVLPLTAETTVNLPAISVQSEFKSTDKPLCNCKTTANFVTADNSTTVQISTTTDDRGAVNMVLPPGKISDLLAISDDGTVAVAAQSVEVPARDVNVPPQPVQCIFSQKSSKITFLNYCRGNRVAFLGDVSGSMGEDGNGKDKRIDVLKRTLSNAVDEVLQSDSTKTVSLCAWNSSQNWCQSKCWLSAADKDGAKAWIQELQAKSGTSMEPAILEAVRLDKVSDIVTLCDGEFTDFNFDAIARYHQEVRFHFVAIGDAAATKQMQQMANVGRGYFQHER